MPGLTENQLNEIVNLERVCSVLSLIGCAVIIVTFLTSTAFHKPINRLVFYAAIGNVLTNVGTLIGRSGIPNPTSVLCQSQAFLIQWFMCADAYWTLAMACNVYLTFFYKYDAAKLRNLEKYYMLACYGVPFVPSLVYLFVTSSQGNRMYGDATLWCWIHKDFDVMRIITFYGPVWVCIILTFFIYGRAGKEIYNKRKQMLSFNRHQLSAQLTSFSEPPSGLAAGSAGFAGSGFAGSGFAGFAGSAMKTTEIHVTSERVEPIDLSELGRRPSASAAGRIGQASGGGMYSVQVSSGGRAGDDEESMLELESGTDSPSHDAEKEKIANGTNWPAPPTPGLSRVTSPSSPTTNGNGLRPTYSNGNGLQPSSSALPMALSHPHPSAGATQAAISSDRAARHIAMEANRAAWSYTKVAMLFFTAMLVTWIPSSANRLYSVINGGEISAPLEYMAAFVLPLQGFWNAGIYCVTSWGAVGKWCRGEVWGGFGKSAVKELASRGRGGDGGFLRAKVAGRERLGSGSRNGSGRERGVYGSRGSKGSKSDESVTELRSARGWNGGMAVGGGGQA